MKLRQAGGLLLILEGIISMLLLCVPSIVVSILQTLALEIPAVTL